MTVRDHAAREGEAPAQPRLAGRLALPTGATESRTAIQQAPWGRIANRRVQNPPLRVAGRFPPHARAGFY